MWHSNEDGTCEVFSVVCLETLVRMRTSVSEERLVSDIGSSNKVHYNM